MSGARERYFSAVIERMMRLRHSLAEPMDGAVQLIVEAARGDHRLFVFGTGHSSMLAEELHYRAGGLALTVPIFAPITTLHQGAVVGGAYERMEGLVAPIFENYTIGAGDVLIVISNSGVNAMPLEAARLGRERGAKIIALTSIDYSTQAAKGRERLADLADIVLDNGAPPGDAVIGLENSEMKVGPISTVIGASILNALIADVAEILMRDGDAPIYRSANMAGSATINKKLVERFRSRNPHL